MMKSVTVANDFNALAENLSCMKRKTGLFYNCIMEHSQEQGVFRFDETLYLAAKTL
jgi:hypothetical protein